MSNIVRRTSSPMAEMLDWLESNTRLNFTGIGLSPYVRVEDYRDAGDYVVRAELPGVDPEKDVEVTWENDMLTISGELSANGGGNIPFRQGSTSGCVYLSERTSVG